MRTVSSTLTNAITLPSAHLQGSNFTVYKSRVYFDDFTSNFPPSDAKAIGSAGNILNEVSFLFSPTVSELHSHYVSAHKVITFYVSDADVLYAIIEGHSTPIELLSNVDHTCRIGVNVNNVDVIYSIYYYNLTDDRWEYQLIDIDLLLIGSSPLTGVVAYFSTLPKGSIYPISGTANTFVLLDIYEGSVRVRIYNNDEDTLPNQYRFVNPIRVLSGTNDGYLLFRAGAVLIGRKIYVYYSHYDGSVRVMVCTLQSDSRHGTWSDIRVAIPQDISVFNINNVFQNNGRIFISGNFFRTSQFASTIVYSLLTWSDDGLTFTMNRRVLVSLMNLPFQCHTDGADIMFASTNRIYKTTAPYQVIGESAENTQLDLVSVSGSILNEMSIVVASGSEQYFDDEKIDTGSYAKLEITIQTSVGVESVKYADCVVSGVDKQIRDGGRGNTIGIMTDATWHTSVMTQPFYMEFQGKQSIYDPCADYSNLYKASSGISPGWDLSTEFVGINGAVFSPRTHNNTTTRHWTRDLADIFMTYPLFGASNDYVIQVYGWSRAGLSTTIPNTPDPTPIDTLNDSFYPVVEYEDAGGVRRTIICTDANLISPSYNHPPQTYFQAHDGSYPVIFSIANPDPANPLKITHLGCDVHSRSASNTTYYLERIEMPGISASIIVNNLMDAAFDTNNYVTTVDGKSVITNYLFNKHKGIPQVMLSTKPYSAFNFEETARMEFHGSYSQNGLIGLCVDEKNFVAAYISKGKIRLIQVVAGVTTVLHEITDTAIVEDTKYDLRFWHKDGIVGFEYKLAASVVWPLRGSILKYEWKYSDGPMATLDDIFHIGVYSFINPPSFRIVGMKGGETIVGALPADVDQIDAFLGTGTIDIDGMLYTYTGKTNHFTGTPGLGPYLINGSSDTNYPLNTDGTFIYQGGHTLDISLFKYAGMASVTEYTDAVLATTSGHGFLIDQIQWQPFSIINGVQITYMEQAKVYSTSMKPWTPAINERVYITDGLLGLTAVDLAAEQKGEDEATQMNSYLHCPGVFAYLDTGDLMKVYGYSATSGDHDQTIHKLIDLFCRLAGTRAAFLGDKQYSQIVTSGSEVTL